MNINSDLITGEFQQIGINTIDISVLEKNWNHLWSLNEWRRTNTWRLIKLLRKDSDIRTFGTEVSEEQAKEIIDKLGLSSNNTFFSSGFTWRRYADAK